MPKYRVYLETTASFTIEVDADDEDAALDAAYGEARGVCAQCSGWGQPWGLDLGEWEEIKADDQAGVKAVELVEDADEVPAP